MTTFAEAYNDAGLLREVTAERMAWTLRHWTASESWAEIAPMAERLAELTGLSLDEVLDSLDEDVQAIEAGALA